MAEEQVRWVRLIARSSASLLIAALFLIALMVATAQQQAISRLDKSMTYSAARKVASDADAARKALVEQEKALATSRIQRIQEKQEQTRLEGVLKASLDRVETLRDGIVASGRCPTLKPDKERLALWGEVYACWHARRIAPEEEAGIVALTDPARDPTQLDAMLARIGLTVTVIDEDMESIRKKVDEFRGVVTAAAQAEAALQDVTLVDRSFIGPLRLTWIPPTLMQIVMCFLSGLFGALLVTLVLIVYPNNNLTLTASADYGNRILLGGLIAVGVLVVVGGGVAVLGSAGGPFDGNANFLAFSAIGILAGMFSDRFAGWLSDRADKLIASSRDPDAESEEEEEEEEEPGPEPPEEEEPPAPAPEEEEPVPPAGPPAPPAQ